MLKCYSTCLGTLARHIYAAYRAKRRTWHVNMHDGRLSCASHSAPCYSPVHHCCCTAGKSASDVRTTAATTKSVHRSWHAYAANNPWTACRNQASPESTCTASLGYKGLLRQTPKMHMCLSPAATRVRHCHPICCTTFLWLGLLAIKSTSIM